jgi:hypothetical protein
MHDAYVWAKRSSGAAALGSITQHMRALRVPHGNDIIPMRTVPWRQCGAGARVHELSASGESRAVTIPGRAKHQMGSCLSLRRVKEQGPVPQV